MIVKYTVLVCIGVASGFCYAPPFKGYLAYIQMMRALQEISFVNVRYIIIQYFILYQYN